MGDILQPTYGSGGANYQAYRLDLSTARTDANPFILPDVPGRFVAFGAGDYYTVNVELQNTKDAGQAPAAIDVNSGGTIEGIPFNRLKIKHAAYPGRTITFFVSQERLAIDFGQSPPVQISTQALATYTSPAQAFLLPTRDNLAAHYVSTAAAENKIKPQLSYLNFEQQINLEPDNIGGGDYVLGGSYDSVFGYGETEEHNGYTPPGQKSIIKLAPGQVAIFAGLKGSCIARTYQTLGNVFELVKIAELAIRAFNSATDAENGSGISWRDFSVISSFDESALESAVDTTENEGFAAHLSTVIINEFCLYNKTDADLYCRPMAYIVDGSAKRVQSQTYNKELQVGSLICGGEFKLYDNVADLIPPPMPRVQTV